MAEQERVVGLERLRLRDVDRVGGKNASLGEMIGQLAAKGIRVPGGFATTAFAYREFLSANGLEQRIRDALANLNIDFRHQVRFGEQLNIQTGVERVGQTSVTLLQTVNANGRVAAEMRSVVVLYDYEQHSPRAIPAALREHFERYRSERA